MIHLLETVCGYHVSDRAVWGVFMVVCNLNAYVVHCVFKDPGSCAHVMRLCTHDSECSMCDMWPMSLILPMGSYLHMSDIILTSKFDVLFATP